MKCKCGYETIYFDDVIEHIELCDTFEDGVKHEFIMKGHEFQI